MNGDFLREAPHRNLPSRYTLAPTEGPRRHNRGLDSRRESSPSAAESRSFGRAQAPAIRTATRMRSLRKSRRRKSLKSLRVCLRISPNR